MNNARLPASLTTGIVRILLPLLVLINLGPSPVAASAVFPTPLSLAGESEAAAVACPCSPSITFLSKPAAGTQQEILSGRVDCANPANYKVAVYIFVGGWWNKPTWTESLTSINADGTWQTDVATAPTDYFTVAYAAFLLPNGVSATHRGGEGDLGDMFDKSDAYLVEARKTIEFSGYTWNVKSTVAEPYESPVGPGPNYFSADPNDVWVDGSGNLHLTLTRKNGKWYATEVYTTKPMVFGTYTFTLASPVDQLDKNAVLGLFTWDDNDPAYHHREIDIEFSRWAQDSGENSQYVVQPHDQPGNRHRFVTTLTETFSTHSFKWEIDKILFNSRQGHAPNLGAEIQNLLYTGPNVPPAGRSNARINLWLINGIAPSHGQRIEVIVEAFTHDPVPATFCDVPTPYWSWNFIERLYSAGITGGCLASPLMYCPEGSVTRAQMAVFLLKGIHGASFVPPPVGPGTGFGDVPPDDWAAAFIRQLAAEGITAGCGNGDYCPEQPVTRAQMAVFLLRSKHGASYVPPPVGPGTGFGDVPPDDWAAAFVKQLVAEGITVGCGSGNYCPEQSVTRAQMAVFLVRTFSLP